MRILHDRPYAHVDWFKRAKACHLYEKYKEVLDFRFYEMFLRNTCMIFAMDYTIPRYKEINAIKLSFKKYIPEGIEGNRYYQEYSHTGFDKLFSHILRNTILGATYVWLRIRIKQFIK
jgi:hypothetical protein